MAAVRVEFGPVSYVFSSARGMLEVPGEQPRESEESLFQCILVHISTSETGQIFPYPPFRCTNFFSSTIFFNSLIGTIKRCNCFPVLMNGYCYVRRCCVTVKELPSTLMVDRVEQGRCGKDASSRYPRALLYGSATRIDPVY